MTDDPNIESKDSENHNSDPSQQHENTPPEQVSIPELKIPQTIIDRYDTHQSEQHRKDRKWFRINVATLIVISIYTAFAGYQGCQMRKAAQAAKDSADAATCAARAAENTFNFNRGPLLNEIQKQTKAMQDSAKSTRDTVKQARTALDASINMARTEQRAWISVRLINLDKMNEGSPLQITVGITNTGKTPAFSITYRDLLVMSPFPIDTSKPTYIVPAQHGTTIFPNATFPWPLYSSSNLSAEQVRAIKAHTLFIYVFGEFKYKDIFNRPHLTKFCGHYLPESNFFGICTKYDYAD
jgi:hypothetical protein